MEDKHESNRGVDLMSEIKRKIGLRRNKLYKKTMNGLDFASILVGITFCKLLVVYLIAVYFSCTNIDAWTNFFP